MTNPSRSRKLEFQCDNSGHVQHVRELVSRCLCRVMTLLDSQRSSDKPDREEDVWASLFLSSLQKLTNSRPQE